MRFGNFYTLLFLVAFFLIAFPLWSSVCDAQDIPNLDCSEDIETDPPLLGDGPINWEPPPSCQSQGEDDPLTQQGGNNMLCNRCSCDVTFDYRQTIYSCTTPSGFFGKKTCTQAYRYIDCYLPWYCHAFGVPDDCPHYVKKVGDEVCGSCTSGIQSSFDALIDALLGN